VETTTIKQTDMMQIKLEMEFELEGTILVCINDEGYDTSLITYGQQYVLDETFTSNEYSCIVLNNKNERASLNRSRFITLEEWREQQLDKLI
jgi:hypothetical protein